MTKHANTTSTVQIEPGSGGVTSRRSLLNAAVPAAMMLTGAGIGTAVAAHAVQPDAELIALCADFDVLERKLQAAYIGVTTAAESARADAVAERVADEQAPILDAITACRPSTLAGFKALAVSLALWDTELLKGDPMQGCTDERLMLTLVRSMVGDPSETPRAPAPAVPARPNPDAALLTLCAEHRRLHGLAYLEGNDDWEAAHHESWQMADKIGDLVPVTQAGHRAKAAVAVAQMDKNRTSDGAWMGDRDALFALDTLKDWLGEA